jgi:hypothetical protein
VKTKPTSSLNEETKALIIERWRTTKLNSIPKISAEFGLSQGIINTVINKYLSSKIPKSNK